MKTMKYFLLLIIAIAFFSCNDKEYLNESKSGLSSADLPFEPADPFLYGVNCGGRKVFKFTSLDHIQNEHKTLYDNYITGGQEEIVLITYEDDKNFYSLRAKDYDMDHGLIPDEPDFDPFKYTSDEILETLLSQDGMVIIGDFIYMWDDGCVIHRKPYNNCTDYNIMLNFEALVSSYSGTVGEQEELMNFRNNDKIEDINICDDYRFDFESISESGMIIDNFHPLFPKGDRSADCGLLTYIEHDIISNDPVEQKIVIKFEANSIAPMGSSPIYSFYIDNASAYESVKIVEGSIPSVVDQEWAVLGGDGYVYPGKWFEVEITYDSSETVPLLKVRLGTVVYPLSEESCSDTNTLALNIECPISMSKKPINAELGEYNFVVEGLEGYVGSYTITWNYGDGEIDFITGVNSVNHQFLVPCILSRTYNVTATINFGSTQFPCVFSPLEATVTTFAPCVQSTALEKYKEKFAGKKARLKIKLKRKNGIFGPGSKLKYKFKYRKSGIKTIESSGNIVLAEGTGCPNIDITSLMPLISQSGKKRLKQKLNSDNFFAVELNDPFTVQFSHENGFSHELHITKTCSVVVE